MFDRAAAASGWPTSSSRVLSDCTINGPSVTGGSFFSLLCPRGTRGCPAGVRGNRSILLHLSVASESAHPRDVPRGQGDRRPPSPSAERRLMTPERPRLHSPGRLDALDDARHPDPTGRTPGGTDGLEDLLAPLRISRRFRRLRPGQPV